MLNFTRQERVVIYFLVITLGLGAILRVFRNRSLENELTPTRFYQEEQEFQEIAALINAGSSEFIDSMGSMESNTLEAGAQGLDTSRAFRIININTASVHDLASLPGIGPALAQRIREYTDQHGPFKHKADIVLVKGIGEKLYARIEGLVSTE